LSVHRHRVLLLSLTAVAMYLRMRSLGADNRVVWDELFFGNFANNYLTGAFYLDVHPPLGKLLITMLFRVFGYNGGYQFVSGDRYPASVPYVQIRCVQAALGSLLVPLAFAMCRALRLPPMTAWLAAVFIVFENALIGISRINVLDNALLVANAAAVSSG
ncbi:Protein O-mannosyltransferase 2, partial [Coemansia sp. RSA 2618]